MMKLPKIKSYGDYSSENYGLHCMLFEDPKGKEFYFSYNTLVAFVHKKNAYESERHVRKKEWGTTTGKHLNWIDGGDKKHRLSSEEFKRKFNEVFGNEETLVQIA